MKPALCLLQNSSRLTVPPRLCSTTCRELDRPSTPARDAWVGGGVNHPVARGRRIQVARGPDIAVDELDAEPLQLVAISLAPRPDEIVQARDLVSLPLRCQRAGNGASRKTADSGYEDSHALFGPGVTARGAYPARL